MLYVSIIDFVEFSTPILHDMIYGIFCLRLLSFIWCYGELNDEMNKYYCARREILQQTAPHLVDSICAYRAGYIAQVSELFARIYFCHLKCSLCGREPWSGYFFLVEI